MKQTLKFSWEDNSKGSLSFRGTKSLSSGEPPPPVTYSTNRKIHFDDENEKTEILLLHKPSPSTPTPQRKMTSVIQGRLFEKIY